MDLVKRLARHLERGGALALVGVALVAAACGGMSSSDKTATAQAGTSATTPAATAGAATMAPTAAATVQVSSTTVAGGATVMIASTAIGMVLTDPSGMTLYVFKNDTAGSGKSACNGGCATNWPPLMASGSPVKSGGLTGDLTVITRDDGTQQVAYKGQPLYRYAPDKAPGDTKGDGVGGVWSVAKP